MTAPSIMRHRVELLRAADRCADRRRTAVHDGQQHQQRRLQQVGHHGGQVVVVAELDLGDADGVVLVDDRQHVPLEQREDGVADVEVAGAAVEVAGGQQDLGGVDAVLVEALLVGPHQEALADGGAGLKVAQVGGPLAQAEPADAGADGPGADQRDLAASRRNRWIWSASACMRAGSSRPSSAVSTLVPTLTTTVWARVNDFLADGIDHGRGSAGTPMRNSGTKRACFGLFI